MILLLFKILLSRKERKLMFKNLSITYAYLIIDGKFSFGDVPKRLKPYVKKALEDLGAGELATDSSTEANPEP